MELENSSGSIVADQIRIISDIKANWMNPCNLSENVCIAGCSAGLSSFVTSKVGSIRSSGIMPA